MTTPTPRITVDQFLNCKSYNNTVDAFMGVTDFARQLEAELAAEKKAYTDAVELLAVATKERDLFQLELTGAQSQLAEAEATMKENHATFLQLRSELESVRSGSAKVCRELRADNAKLRAALEPFANAATHIERQPDNTGLWATTGTKPEWNYCITVGHIRQARAALASTEATRKPSEGRSANSSEPTK